MCWCYPLVVWVARVLFGQFKYSCIWCSYSFSPKWKLDLTKYILWSNLVHLIDTFRFLHGHLILTHNMTSFLLTGILLYIVGISASLLLTNYAWQLHSFPLLLLQPKKKKRKWLQALNYTFICKYTGSNILIVWLLCINFEGLVLPQDQYQGKILII